MSALTVIVISGLIQGGLLWASIRLLDPANTSNKPVFAVLVGLFLSLVGYSFGLFLLLPLVALGWILLRGYDLGLLRTVGVVVLLGAGNWAVGQLLVVMIENLGLRTVEFMLIAGAGLVVGRWFWKRRGNAGARADRAPARAVARDVGDGAPVAPTPAATVSMAPPPVPPAVPAPRPAAASRSAASPPAVPQPPAPAALVRPAAVPETAPPSPLQPGDEPKFLR